MLNYCIKSEFVNAPESKQINFPFRKIDSVGLRFRPKNFAERQGGLGIEAPQRKLIFTYTPGIIITWNTTLNNIPGTDHVARAC